MFSVLPETNRKLPTDITEVAELSADRFSCLEVGGTNIEMGTGRVKIDTRSCERNLDVLHNIYIVFCYSHVHQTHVLDMTLCYQ